MSRQENIGFDMGIVQSCDSCRHESLLPYNRPMEKEVRDRLDRLEKKIDVKSDRIRDKMDGINQNISALLGPLAKVSEKTDGLARLVWWLFGILAGIIGTVALAVFKGV